MRNKSIFAITLLFIISGISRDATEAKKADKFVKVQDSKGKGVLKNYGKSKLKANKKIKVPKAPSKPNVGQGRKIGHEIGGTRGQPGVDERGSQRGLKIGQDNEKSKDITDKVVDKVIEKGIEALKR